MAAMYPVMVIDQTGLSADAINLCLTISLPALGRIHTSHPNTSYWIDAVCIDQLDDIERSEQVAIMDKIYQRADANPIWLGNNYDDTAKVNDILHDTMLLEAEEQHLSAEVESLFDQYGILATLFSRRTISKFWFRFYLSTGFTICRHCRSLLSQGTYTCDVGNVSIDVEPIQKATEFLARRKIPSGHFSYGNENLCDDCANPTSELAASCCQ